MSKQDIQTLNRNDFDWADGKRAASLLEVHNAVVNKLEDAIHWYARSRSTMRKVGQLIRYGVILFGAATAAWPTLAEIVSKTNQGDVPWWLHGATATLFGVIAAALLLLDRFAGATSGWIRYAIAGMSLIELRDELSISWLLETGTWAGLPDPNLDQTKHALTILQGFISRADQIVHDETNQWKMEFQNALQQIDEYAKTTPKKFETVPCTIKIANPDRLVGTWTVSINGGPDESATSDSKAFALPPGNITVKVRAEYKVTATNQTKTYSTEMADTLVVGTPKVLAVTLPQN